MIKVLHFVESWLPQTVTWLYNHIRLLPKNVESYVVCQSVRNLDQFPINNLFCSQRSSKIQRLVAKVGYRLCLRQREESHFALLERIIQKYEPDVLHSHFGHFGWINSGLARKYGLPHIVSFYGADVSYLPRIDGRWKERYHAMGDRVDLVLCEGPYMACSIAKLGIPPERIRVFRLGIDLAQIPFMPRSNPRERPLRYLIAGTFREKKGIPYALEALDLLSKHHPNFEITVIGDSAGSEREEQEKAKILDAVKRSGLGAKTHFMGFRPYRELIEAFYRHDILVSPSVTSSDGDTEGGAPVTIIEAAASGMPIISTRHCDIPFVLSEENAPYLVSERDPVGLSSAMDALIQRRDWSRLLTANRRFIEKELDLRNQVAELADVYDQQVGRIVNETESPLVNANS